MQLNFTEFKPNQKKWFNKSTVLLTLCSLLLFAQSYAQTITTSAIAGAPFCAGASVNVAYTKTGTFNPGNVFTAELSDASGSFASPVAIGALTSVNAGTVASTIPANAATGNGYRIRVVASNPVVTGTSNAINLTINAKPATPIISTDYCVGGGFVQLTSSAASSYLWSTGQTTQTILANLAGTYTVTVSNAAGCTNTGSIQVSTELAVNGNFEAGNTGFTTGYPFLSPTPVNPNGLVPEELYTITTDASFYHPNFYARSRTNTGTGRFMVFNGSGALPIAWQQNVDVVAGTTYYFSAYALSVNNVSPFAQLQFNINGSQLGTVAVLGAGATAVAGPFNWVRFFGQYVATTTGSIVISIVDLETSLSGNDFAIDDVSFSPLSPASITVNPTSNSGVPACALSPINFASNLIGGMSPITYSWTGPNGFTSALANPVIPSSISTNAGLYTVTVTDVNGCTSAGSTTVIVNPATTVTAGISSSSICLGQSVNLTSTGSGATATAMQDSFDGITNNWTTTNTSTGGTPATAAWTLRPNGYNPELVINSNNASQFYLCDSWNQNGTATNTILRSAPINTVGYTSLSLNFFHYFRFVGSTGNAARVEVSTNNTTWTTVATYSSNEGTNTAFLSRTINLNAYIGNATLYVRFRYASTARAKYWAIDNVRLNGNTSASFSWSSIPVGFTSNLQNPTAVAPTVSTTYTPTLTFSIGCTTSAAPVSVVVGSVLTSSATPSEFCLVGGTSVLTVTVPAGYTADWYANPSGGSPLAGGANTLTYSPVVLATTTYYVQVRKTNSTCSATSRTPITVTVNGVQVPSVAISVTSGTNPACNGTNVTFTAVPTNGGSAPTYQWTKNGVNIPSATSSTYTGVAGSAFVDGDLIRVVITSNANCASPTVATSSAISIGVSPILVPSVNTSITSGNNPACNGSSITFTAVPTNGGAAPAYQWTKNGINITGATSATYTGLIGTNLLNGDIIRVVLTSNANCVSTTIATSANTTLSVIANLAPTVATAITTGSNPTCINNSVIFTATPTNGGAAPLYQWTKNGINIGGATSSTYTALSGTDFINNDLIRVVLTSNLACALPTTVTSTAIAMVIKESPTASASATPTSVCSGAAVNLTSTAPTIKPATILSENFNAATNSWTKTNNSTGGNTATAAWTLRPNGYNPGNAIISNTTSQFYLTDSRNQNGTLTRTTLVSPVMNTIGYTTLSLNFWHYYRYVGPAPSDSAIVEVSTNGGANWTIVASYVANQGAPNVFVNPTINLNAYINNATFNIRFRYATTARKRYWAIDNVTITGTPITYTYNWSSTPAGFSSATQNPTANPTVNSVYSVTVNSSNGCTASASSAQVNVNPSPVPSVATAITTGSNPTCNGNSVTFTATPTNGGASPAYQWTKNGANIAGANSDTYTAVAGTNFVSGDLIRVVLTSNAACASPAVVTSTPITMIIDANITPTVSVAITSGSNPTCNGSAITFTATPTNAGTSPTYDFRVDGISVQNGSSNTFTTSTLTASQQVDVLLTSNNSCASTPNATSNVITITFLTPVTPTISISSSQTNLCTVGISFSSSITNGGSSPAYQWKRNGTNISGANSATFTSTGLFNGDEITCELTSNAACPIPAAVVSNSINVVLTGATTTWLGLTNDWSIGSPINWSNGYPSSNTTAVIAAGTANQPIINDVVECFNIQIESGASLTINGVNQINVYGKFTNNGTFNAGFGSVEFLSCSGTSVQAHEITSNNGTVTNFFNVTLNDLAGLNLTADANISGTLTLTNGNFNNATNVFTFVSTASGTARIAPVPATANFVGNITMQRFAPGPKTGWTQLGTPVQGATLAQWQDDFATSGYTGSTGTVGGFISVYTYNEPTSGLFDEAGSYLPATNVTNSIPVGKGFWIYLGTGSVNTANVTIDVTGQPHTGSFNFNPSYTNSGFPFDDGYNLIANPYPSAIDWLSPNWTKTNINNAIYMYQADNGQFASFVDGIATNGGSRFIASSQGFYIQTNAASPVLSITENAKTTSNPVLIKEEDPANVLRIKINGDNVNDEMVIHLNQYAKMNFDGNYDAKKMFSNDPMNPSISSLKNAYDLSINSLPFSGSTMSIPVRVTVGSNGMYNLTWSGMEGFPEGSCFVIEDLDNGIKTTLENNGVYYFNATAGFKAPRFVIHVSTPLPRSIAEASCSNSKDGSITVTNPSTTESTVQLKDVNGNIIKEATITNNYTFDKLAVGTYQLNYPLVTACGDMTQLLNITAAEQLSANFEVSAKEVKNTEELTFTTTQSKGNNLTWDFGDGTTANGTSIIKHQYKDAGVYEVSLTNSKGECSITERTVLTVSKGIQSQANSMEVNQQNGAFYAVFNFAENTLVTIRLTNAIGQEVAATQQFEGKNGRVKLQLDNAAEGIYMIILNNGKESFTQKIVK